MATALVPRIFHRHTPNRRRNGFSAFDSDLDAIFEGFFGNWPTTSVVQTAPTSYTPRVNVEENEKSFLVSAEVPGVDQDDLSLTLSPEGDVLILKGEKKLEKEEDHGVRRFERSFGAFERHIRLPDSVETDAIEAKMKNGVLTVVLPKRQPEPPKTINIKIS